jgi:G:T-mismatch repair DNA endonuclease (very short patch repair protein)
MASNLSKLEIVNKVLDQRIKNLKGKKREFMFDALINAPDIKCMRTGMKLAYSMFPCTNLSQGSPKYWINRGWDSVQAKVNAAAHMQIVNKKANRDSPYSMEFWTKKINPVTGNNYTEIEADFERNSRRPIRPEYWIKKGYTQEIAKQLAVDAKFKNNKKGANNAATTDIRRATSKRCIEYYTARGHSDEEAAIMRSNSQKYFSKEICIQKHGELEGLKVWNDRQEKWQETLSAKSNEEKARINRLKLFKGGSVSKGETLLFEMLTFNNISCVKQHSILKSQTTYYVYDIVSNKKIIEYNGDYWHANPKKYMSTDILRFPGGIQVQASSIWSKDQQKQQYAQDQGYEVLVIWESDFKKNKEEVVKKCIQFLTQ